MHTHILVLTASLPGSRKTAADRWVLAVMDDLKARGHGVWPVYVGDGDPPPGEGPAPDRVPVKATGARAALAALVETHHISHCLAFGFDLVGHLDRLPKPVARLLAVRGEIDPADERAVSALACADVVLAPTDTLVAQLRDRDVPAVVLGRLLVLEPEERRYTGVEKLGYAGGASDAECAALSEFLPIFEDYAAGIEAPVQLRLTGPAARHFAAQPEMCFDHVIYDPDGDPFAGVDLAVALAPGGEPPLDALSRGVPTVATAAAWQGLMPLSGYHDLGDGAAVLACIERLQREGFDTLTRLSNFAKASCVEYRLNFERTIDEMLDQPRAKLADWVRAHPGYLGSHQAHNSAFQLLDMAQATVPAGDRPTIAHVVNPVRMPKTSDLYIAQPVAFRSMRRAQEATRAAEVHLVARRFPEDEGYLADCFDLEMPLTRSAQDLDLADQARKLPLLADIFTLDGLPEHVTHIVYTNSDIGLQPHFYDFAADRIAEGYDALVINRRTLPRRFADAADLTRLYAEDGVPHPGFDCFVVSRAVLGACDFAQTLIGVHLIGRVVFLNLLARAGKIGYFDDLRLTFHIGDDVPSKGHESVPYIRHNLKQGASVARSLRDAPGYLQTDPGRLDRFERVLNVMPGPLQGPAFDPETDRRHRVQMHGFFRTGSTFLFQKLRHRKDWTAYYEPFHEELALFSPATLDDARDQHRPSKFRHAQDTQKDWFFAEYEPLLKSGCVGVEGYDRRMSYVADFPGHQSAVQHYIDLLTERATTKNVFLQFNRTPLRQDQMRSLFPDDTHLYLRRGLRDLWGSYLSFTSEGTYGFMRNNLAFLSYNPDHPLVRALAEHLPLAPSPFTTFFHSAMGELFHYYTLEQHFLIHAVLWHGAEAQASQFADVVIDLAALSEDRLLRLETEAQLAMHDIPVDFRDVQAKIYDLDELQIVPTRMDELEEMAQGIAYRAGQTPVAAVPASDRIDPIVAAKDRRRRRQLHEQLQHRLVATGAERLPLVEGTVGARQMERDGVLVFGFHPSERYHVWGDGAQAMLRFKVPHAADTRIELRIHSFPGMVERFQETQIFINDDWQGEYRLGADWERHRFQISRSSLAAADGVVEIGFVVQRFFGGQFYGSRDLSICLSELCVEQAIPAGVKAD